MNVQNTALEQSLFNNLAAELMDHCFQDLPIKEKLEFRTVCKAFDDVIRNGNLVTQKSLDYYRIKRINNQKIYWIEVCKNFLATPDSVFTLDLSGSMLELADKVNNITRSNAGISYLIQEIAKIPHLETFGVNCMIFNVDVSVTRVYSLKEAGDVYRNSPIINETNFTKLFKKYIEIEAFNRTINRNEALSITLVSDFEENPVNAQSLFDVKKVHKMNFNLVRFENTPSSDDFQHDLRSHFKQISYEQRNMKKRSHLFVRAFKIHEPLPKRRRIS